MGKRAVILWSTVALATILLALPAAAQQDRSSDTSFGSAGRAEYNRPVVDVSSGSSSGSSDSSSDGGSSDGPSSARFLPETGGPALLPGLGAAGLLAGSALLVGRAIRGRGL